MRIAIAGASGLVGSRLAAALEDGHDVVAITRGDGIDASDRASVPALEEAFTGADVVIDVTNIITPDAHIAREFFTRAARNIARAASVASVQRVVLLSIIGVDRIPDDAHYAAKFLQEQTYRERRSDVRIVRAAHFHEFAGMAAEWGRNGRRIDVPDFPVQPVHLDAVVDALIAAATSPDAPAATDIAGPERVRLPELVRQLMHHHGEDVDVIAAPASPPLASGACLPPATATIDSRTFAQWLGSQDARGGR